MSEETIEIVRFSWGTYQIKVGGRNLGTYSIKEKTEIIRDVEKALRIERETLQSGPMPPAFNEKEAITEQASLEARIAELELKINKLESTLGHHSIMAHKF